MSAAEWCLHHGTKVACSGSKYDGGDGSNIPQMDPIQPPS